MKSIAQYDAGQFLIFSQCWSCLAAKGDSSAILSAVSLIKGWRMENGIPSSDKYYDYCIQMIGKIIDKYSSNM